LEEGARWAVLINRGFERGVWQIELWQWPFGAAPLEQFELPYFTSYRMAAAGSLLACEDAAVHVIDLSLGRSVREIAGPEPTGLGVPCWLPGGGLAIGWHMPRSYVTVHAGDGTLLHTLKPAGHWHGLAANQQSLVLVYHEGFVMVPWASVAQSDAETPVAIAQPWGEPDRVASSFEAEIEAGEPDFEAMQVPLAGVTDEATLRSALDANWARTAWRPRLRRQRGAVTASKLGGTPFLAQHEPWPNCGVCGQPLELFLQLNAADLPEELRARFTGLLQVFLCVTDGHATGTCAPGYNPVSKAVHARLCVPSGAPRYPQPPFADAFIESVIEAWLPVDDYPARADWGKLPDDPDELQDDEPQDDEAQDDDLDDARDESMTEDDSVTLPGDKLWGWPAWPQSSGYLTCPHCGDPMDVIFQIASEGALPHTFADAGTAWVHQCGEHPEVVRLTWAS
jgi:hypothetical protein